MSDSPATLAGLFGLTDEPGRGAAKRVTDRVLTGPEKKRIETELNTVPEVTRAAARAEVARAVRGLLDIPVPEVLARGWRTLDAVRTVAAESREAPNKRFELALGAHEVMSRHEPSLEISVNGQIVATVPAEAKAAFRIESAVLVIRAGCIGAVEAATFHVRGALSCRGVEIATARTGKLKLPGAVTLDPAVEIPV